jgi:hypothetical protein
VVIKDAEALLYIEMQWTAVLALRDRIQRQLFMAMTTGGTYPTFAADCAHNLPFLHACSVLNAALQAMRDEGQFESRNFFLGTLVAAAKHSIEWVDYVAVVETVEKRDQLAHHGMLLPRADCWRHLAVVENELRGWSIIV